MPNCTKDYTEVIDVLNISQVNVAMQVVLQTIVLFLMAVMAFSVLNHDCRATHDTRRFDVFWNVKYA